MKIVRAVFDETKSLTVRSEILLYMGLGTECQRLIEFIRRLVRRHPKQEDVVKSVLGSSISIALPTNLRIAAIELCDGISLRCRRHNNRRQGVDQLVVKRPVPAPTSSTSLCSNVRPAVAALNRS